MKKLLFVLMTLCAGMAAQAQTIHLDHHFWDGYSLYTVKEIRMGKYFYMTTSQGEELTLEKVDGKPGEYKIIPSRQMNVPLAPSTAGGCSILLRRVRVSWLSVSQTVM